MSRDEFHRYLSFHMHENQKMYKNFHGFWYQEEWHIRSLLKSMKFNLNIIIILSYIKYILNKIIKVYTVHYYN